MWDAASQAVTPLAELELELEAGEPKALFDFARLLSVNVPLRFEPKSKFEMASALKSGTLFLAGPHPKVTGAAEMIAGEYLQQALMVSALRIAALQPLITELRRPEAIKQMRVALRRFRSVERTMRPYLKKPGLRPLARRAQQYGRALAAARDWDVFMVETLQPIQEDAYAPIGSGRLHQAAAAARGAAWASAVQTLRDPAFTGFVIDLVEAAVLAPWRHAGNAKLNQSAGRIAPKALDRALQSTVKLSGHIHSNRPEDLHCLRITLKKLRYAAQTFRVLYPRERRKPFMAAMSALQDILGAINDSAVASELAERAAMEGGPEAMRAAGFISGYKAAEANAVREVLDIAWADFKALQPFWRTEE